MKFIKVLPSRLIIPLLIMTVISPLLSSKALAFYDQYYRFASQKIQEHQCVDFYIVYRPVAPLVNHLYIGAELIDTDREFRNDSLLVQDNSLFIYGAVKGQSDFDFFKQALRTGAHQSVSHSYTACGLKAERAMSLARNISMDWLYWLDSNIYFYSRIIATPVMGRPCAMAAWEIIEAFGEPLSRD